MFVINSIKEFQITKGPSKVDNPITNRIYRYKIWGILFCKNNVGAENKDPRMYVQWNQFCMYAPRGMNEKRLIIYPKMNEIVSLTLIRFPTPLGGFSPFSWWPLIFHFSPVSSLL